MSSQPNKYQVLLYGLFHARMSSCLRYRSHKNAFLHNLIHFATVRTRNKTKEKKNLPKSRSYEGTYEGNVRPKTPNL